MEKKSKKIKYKNHGFTLVELLVAIALFSILIAVAVGGFANSLRTERQISSLIAAQSNVSAAIETMAREIRTGSSFCSSGGNGSSACACNSVDPITGAEVCSDIVFTNDDGQVVVYNLQNGQLNKSVDGGSTYAPVTGSNVTIPYFTVIVFGNTPGDHWNPRITITLGVSPNDPTLSAETSDLQTTISARAIDCDSAGNC